MIHSARLTSSEQFSFEICFVLLDFEKCVRTYIRTTRVKTVITTGRDYGSAEWINPCKMVFPGSSFQDDENSPL